MTPRGKLSIWTMLLVSVIPVASAVALLPEPASAGDYTPHDPILIQGNTDFTAENGVTGGSGRLDDPYVIEGWEIDSSGRTGIEVRDADAHFIIRHVYIHGDGFSTGIYLENVTDGRVEDALITQQWNAIRAYSSQDLSVADSDISSSSWTGISLSNSVNVTVAGNLLNDTGTGVDLFNSTDVTIKDSLVTNNTWSGIYAYASDNVTLVNNVLSRNSGGLKLAYTTNATIAGNSFSSDGVLLKGGSLEHFVHTFAANNAVNGKPLEYYRDCGGLVFDRAIVGQLILVNCASVVISDLQVEDTDVGLEMAYVSSAVVQGANISASDYGMYVFAGRDLVVSGSQLSNNSRGLYLRASMDIVIEGNNVSSNDLFAIRVSSSENVTVASNRLDSNSLSGVDLYYSTNVTVTDNDISRGGYGVHLVSGYLTTVQGNSVSDNDQGIQVVSSSNITLAANNLTKNGYRWLCSYGSCGHGVYLWDSYYVEVYHNNFVSNANQAYDNLGDVNTWDDGYPSGGNYWSNFKSEDECSGPGQDVCPEPDGVYDDPYALDSNTTDRYPLMVPFGSPETPPVASFDLEPAEGDVTVVFSVDASASEDGQDASDALEVRWDWEGDGVWDTPWTKDKRAEHRYEEPGEYNIYLEVRDSAGLKDVASSSVTVYPDTTPPDIFHTPPEDVMQGETINITATVSDANGVVEVRLYYRNSQDGSFQVVTMQRGGSLYWATVQAENPGEVLYYIVAIDAAGNEARNPAEGDYKVRVARQPFSLPLDPAVMAGIVAAALVISTALFLLWRRDRERREVLTEDVGPGADNHPEPDETSESPREGNADRPQ